MFRLPSPDCACVLLVAGAHLCQIVLSTNIAEASVTIDDVAELHMAASSLAPPPPPQVWSFWGLGFRV